MFSLMNISFEIFQIVKNLNPLKPVINLKKQEIFWSLLDIEHIKVFDIQQEGRQNSATS